MVKDTKRIIFQDILAHFVDIDFIPHGNNPEDEVSGYAITGDEWTYLKNKEVRL